VEVGLPTHLTNNIIIIIIKYYNNKCWAAGSKDVAASA
jgi:hypothetical protein